MDPWALWCWRCGGGGGCVTAGVHWTVAWMYLDSESSKIGSHNGNRSDPDRKSSKTLIWLVVSKCFKHEWIIFHFIYGMSSFPLTNSYFSRWLLHHQPVMCFLFNELPVENPSGKSTGLDPSSRSPTAFGLPHRCFFLLPHPVER